MLFYSANVLLLQHLVMQARDDTTAMPGRTDGIETEDAAVRVRADAADFLASVQAAYIEIRDAAGAVMEVVARRRRAWPIVNEAEAVAGEKRCSRCGERKQLIEFYMVQKTHYKPRRDSWCRSCRRAANRVKREGGNDGKRNGRLSKPGASHATARGMAGVGGMDSGDGPDSRPAAVPGVRAVEFVDTEGRASGG